MAAGPPPHMAAGPPHMDAGPRQSNALDPGRATRPPQHMAAGPLHMAAGPGQATLAYQFLGDASSLEGSSGFPVTSGGQEDSVQIDRH